MAGGIESYLAGALRAVDAITAGHVPSDVDLHDLERFETWLQLPRSFASYAPRSRRRFVAAAKRGERPAAMYRREREQRASHTLNTYGVTPAQYTRINRLRKRIVEDLQLDVDPYLDWDNLQLVVEVYGAEYVVEVLSQQIDSTEHYIQGDPMPGRNRWNARGELEAAFGASGPLYSAAGTDPYYYYHGRR